MSEHVDELKDEEREKMTFDSGTSPSEKRNNNWIGGVVLIAIGVIFLLSNLTDFQLNNWWALFILIPAIFSFGKAWEVYREEGRLTHEARGSITGGLILTLIASAFLFSLDWGLIWPLFLIIGGLAALFGGWFS